jgi:hypothetical protein
MNDYNPRCTIMLLRAKKYGRTGAAIVLFASMTLPTVAIAQDDEISARILDQDDLDQRLAQTPPPQVGTTRLDQRFFFNGLSLRFDESTFVDLPLQSGDAQNTVLRGTVAHVANVEAEQNLEISGTNQRLNTRQSALIFQLDTMDRQRVVTQRLDETGELLGFRLDLSLTGQCISPGSPVDGYCTYTPGIATILGEIDPDLLTPTAFLISSEFGQVIPEAVHQSLFAPEFQRGEDVVGGPLVGVSFDIINSGFASDGSASSLTASRNENTRLRFVPTIASVEQTLSTNSAEAAATRSVRAFVLPDRDEVDAAYLAMQLAAWLFPAANSNIDYAAGAPNTSVSNNIFLSLNNARVPADSYTIFQTGRANVVHSSRPPQSAAETPVATYNGVWMGMSPARTVRTSQRLQFIQTGDRTSVNDPAFVQGGFGTPFADIVDAGITLIDDFDQSITNVNLQNIDDLFIQFDLDVTRQDAIRRVTSTETTDYRLVPHLSFSGNRTGGEDVLRYYAGIILSDEANAYIGTDYTLATEDGWNAYARLDLYSAPDLDYRSEAEVRGSRTFTVNPERLITVGASAITELDNSVLKNGDGFSEDSAQANIFGRWREGRSSFTLNERFTRNVLGDYNQSTTMGFGYQLDDGVSMSAQVTPWSTEDSYIDAALGVNVQLEGLSGEPVLQAQIARARYQIGTSSFGDSAEATETVLKVGLQMNF